MGSVNHCLSFFFFFLFTFSCDARLAVVVQYVSLSQPRLGGAAGSDIDCETIELDVFLSMSIIGVDYQSWLFGQSATAHAHRKI